MDRSAEDVVTRVSHASIAAVNFIFVDMDISHGLLVSFL